MEDVVRERHKLEDRIEAFRQQIDRFLDLCMIMEVRNMETCMAQLYDLMSQATNEADRLDKLFKGKLLKSAYDKRKSGQRGSFWRKFSHGSVWYFEITNWDFSYPVLLTEELATEWGDAGGSTVTRLLTAHNP
jgi:hypothetical protein